MQVIGYRHQRTLKSSTEVVGVGFVTGARVRVRLHPAAVNSGLVFCRSDDSTAPKIPARTTYVTGTQRRTTLGSTTQGVTLVEHLLAALSGLRVDNCSIEIDGPEPPGLDGSARGYIEAIADAGVVQQPGRRPIWTPSSTLTVSAGGATIGLYPATQSTELRISYILDYGSIGPITRQCWTLNARPDEFMREIAHCRTFVTDQEANALRAQGVGKHLTTSDLLVFGPRGVIDNKLRYANEPARHKILDLIGDLALCGFDLAGHLVAYRSGHALNVALAQKLAAHAESSSMNSMCLKFPTRSSIARAA